jgi:predicted GIY-YIG superfamily endonuclease
MVYIYSLKLQSGKYYVGKTDNPNLRLEDHFVSAGSAWTKKYSPISIHQVIPDMNNHDEQRVTQEYIAKYGIDNVRGGPWVKVILSDTEKVFIKNLINGETDKCFKCGSGGHFANSCNKVRATDGGAKDRGAKDRGAKDGGAKDRGAKDRGAKDRAKVAIATKIKNCKRCMRLGHSQDNCYAKTYSNGRQIEEVSDNISDNISDDDLWQCEFCKKEFDSEKGCRFHENVHCSKRRTGRNKHRTYTGAKLLQEELYESSDSSD